MIVENIGHPAVDKVLLQLSAAYQLSEVREGIHCTDVIYCPRKAYWNKTNPLPPTPIESIHFLRGLGLQEALLRGVEAPSLEVDGIWVSPDYYEGGVLLELKTTMMGKKRLDAHDFPEGWIKQLKSYCYAFKQHSAVLLVLPLLTRELLCYIFTFTEEELKENWDWIWTRAKNLEIYLQKSEVPEEKGFDFECNDCRYRLRCLIEKDKGGVK